MYHLDFLKVLLQNKLSLNLHHRSKTFTAEMGFKNVLKMSFSAHGPALSLTASPPIHSHIKQMCQHYKKYGKY